MSSSTRSPNTSRRKSRIEVKVVPRSSRTELAGWLGDRLKVRVAAAPEQGRANAALVDCLADVLEISRRNIRVVAGHTAAEKLVEIDGLDSAALDARLPRR